MHSPPLIPGLHGVRRRVVYVSIYELIAIAVATLGLAQFSNQGTAHAGVMAVAGVAVGIVLVLLLFVVVRLLNLTVLGDLATFFAMLYVPFHMYRQLRGAYRSSRFGAFVRANLLVCFSLFAVISFLFLLLAVGVSG